MTIRSLQKIFLSCLLLLFLACNTNKKLSEVANSNCETPATVKDFTGLDGCGLLIVLENGDKLLPAKLNDESFTLRDGQKIKLNYKELEGMASICMAEKASIEITCIELIEGKPAPVKCYDTKDPLTVPWMKEVIKTKKPASIQKYNFRSDGWAYLFFVGQKQFLYDCQGTLLCEHQGLSVNKCKEKYVAGQRGEVIYRNQADKPNR